jgi:hypothetical protein
VAVMGVDHRGAKPVSAAFFRYTGGKV